MPTITYTIIDFASETGADWFRVSCSFHPDGHQVLVATPYTNADVKTAVQQACRAAYQQSPAVGQSWSQTF